MDVNHSGYPRHEHDFYMEPAWCFDAAGRRRATLTSPKGVYDPASAWGQFRGGHARSDFRCVGSDIVDRPKAGHLGSRT